MYYDGSNWKWDNWEDDASEFWERYREAVKDYGNKLNHKGDEMDESLVKKLIEDLDRISKKIEEIQARLKVEKKKPRKLFEILQERTVWTFIGKDVVSSPDFRTTAQAAIDAVIECYEDYMSSPRKIDFKNWLTQRLL